VVTKAFTTAAELRARGLGMPAFPIVVVAHPLASKKPEEVREMARRSLPEVVRALTSQAHGIMLADGAGT
jgi:hypothetical protein